MYALNQGHNTHTIRYRTHRRDGTGGALKKLEPNDLIVFPHRYRRDGTHRKDRTGGAKKREGNFILKRGRTRCYPSHDYGIFPTTSYEYLLQYKCCSHIKLTHRHNYGKKVCNSFVSQNIIFGSNSSGGGETLTGATGGANRFFQARGGR